MRTELGRISKATFGWGGYDDAMIGLSIQLEGKGWGTSDFKGWWSGERSSSAKWTEGDRLRTLGEVCMFLRDLLTKSKRKNVADLVGVPVEATFEANTLKSWRVLEEVI